MSDGEATTVTFEDHCWKGIVPPETLRVYEPYQRDLFVAAPVTLLAVDLFAGVFPDERLPIEEAIAGNPRSCGQYAWDAKPPIADLLSLFRDSGRDVIYSTQDVAATTNATKRRSGQLDPADFELHEDFTPATGEMVIKKGRASVFYQTPLLNELRRLETKTLVLCGETTSGCVRATAVDAYSHGFHVVVVEDAVFDRSPLSHAVTLFDLHHKYADVMTLAELRGHLGDAR